MIQIMQVTRFFLIAGLWMTFQATSLAQNTSIRPGLWEMEQRFEMPGSPTEGFKWQYCVTEEVSSRGPVFSDLAQDGGQRDCQVENLRYLEPGHVSYDIVCRGEATRMEMEFWHTETTFEGTARVVSEEGTLTFRMQGRYLGPCENREDMVGATERILNWAERTFPQFFPSHQPTQTLRPWLYRYYPETSIYAGINSEEAAVYVLGGPFGDVPLRVTSVVELLRLCGC